MDTNREIIEKLLTEEKRELSNKHLWVWGAGDTAVLYQQGLLRLEEEGFKIEGYVDSDPKKQGNLIGTKKIFKPEALCKIENVCVLICSIREEVLHDVKSKLETMNIEHYFLDEIILKNHSKEVLSCYDMLTDDKSRKIYAGIIKWRLTGCKTNYPVDIANDYFVLNNFRNLDSEEVLLIVGRILEILYQIIVN